MKLDTRRVSGPDGNTFIKIEQAAGLLGNFLTALEGEPQPLGPLMNYAKVLAERQLTEWGIAR